ncbi:MAG TPA: LysE family translocator [Opitutaceae bacterium]|nr:LysE family translocator [Opitutaceae bacterium]
MLINLAWLLAVLTLGLLSPGPDFLLIVKNSVGTPRAYALGTVAGIATGLAAQMLVISLGFVAASPAALRGVQLGGAVFLAYLGWRALRAAPGPGAAETGAAGAPGVRSGFVQGLICNLTNPKAFLFFVSVFAQTLRPDTDRRWRVVLPVAVVVHGATAWSLVVAALQSPPVARRLERAQRWLPRAFGAALVVLAGAVVVEACRG